MSLPILRYSTIYGTSSFGFISSDGRLLDPSTTVRYELLLGKKKKVFGVSSVCSQLTNKRRWYAYLSLHGFVHRTPGAHWFAWSE